MTAVFAAAVVSSSAVAAGVLQVRAIPAAPRIDGVISPGEWDGAALSDGFRQVRPRENAEPSERTEVWVTYDADFIYVAVRAHDSAGPAGIRSFSMGKDTGDRSDDSVRIVFDTFNRQNDGYYFGLTAAGGRSDGLIENKESTRAEWDGLWFGRTSIDVGGWSAEFAIPAKTLSFDPANDTWGFNVSRSLMRLQETIRWSGYLRSKNVSSLAHAGKLVGIDGLRQGRGLDFKPYLSGVRRSGADGEDDQSEFNTGFDVVWNITPSLSATFTVNTDFADAEVDERQINLGRFPLFFPEKRSFFLKDAPLFSFGGIRRTPLPFHSRKIGRSANGEKIDLLGGVKLTGRAGPFSLGILDVQMDEFGDVGSKNLFVGRASVDVLSESSVGLIVTNGDPRANGDNTLAGADFSYVNNRFRGDRTLEVRASGQFTESDRQGGQGGAGMLTISYPNDPVELFFNTERVSRNYDPALGFVSRRGIQFSSFWGEVTKDINSERVRDIEGFVEAIVVHDLDWRRLDYELFTGGEIKSIGGDRLNVFAGMVAERLDESFEIRPGIVIPAGDHKWNRYGITVSTESSRPLRGEIGWRSGSFFSGTRTDLGAEIEWRPTNRLRFGTEFEWRIVKLPEGDFTLRQNTTEAGFSFSPDLELSLISQYDNFSREVGVNVRVRWTPSPGNDFYVVVNQGYDTARNGFRPTQNESSVKGSWTYRF